MAGQHDGHLGAVYDARTTDEVAAGYDRWAETYEAEMAATGYRHPSVGLALLARHAPRGAGPVLDAGCGTGLLGDWLGILGFGPLEGLDISPGMLAVAARKGTYIALHRQALGGALPFADGAFAAVISTGVFTTGHVGFEGMPELIRATKPGGVLVITVKLPIWEGGFAAALAGTPGVSLAEQTAPYISMPGDTATVASLAVALRRTQDG